MYAYTYEPNGWLHSDIGPDGQHTYSYDASGQLTGDQASSSSTPYSYDANGNRNASVDVNGTDNLLTSDGTNSYTYDADGNRLTATSIATGAVTTYTWDYHNQLTEARTVSSTGQEQSDEKFTYDMFGQMIADSLDASGSGAYTTTYTVYDISSLPQPGRMANNAYADFSSTGSLETRYLTGPTLDQIFGQVAANGTTTWNLTDSQGSVRQVVGVTGNVLDTIDYDAYGNITSESNASAGSRFKYDGMAWDAALGLYLDHARAYDPADGVFISQDPMSFAAGQSNLSEYVGNGPTDGTDPSGEWGVAGHFWTTYLVAVAAGKSPEEANSLAYYSQLPDQSSIYDAVSNVKAAGANVMANSTGMVAPSDNAWEYGVNTWLHSLHGGAAQPRQQMLSDMIRQGGMSDWQMGFLLHAYGDSFAHTYTNANGCLVAYSWPLGHGPQGHDPDTIGRHTDAYKGYVDQLFKTLGGNASDENAMKMLDQIKLAADWMNQTNDPSVSKFADSDTGEASTMEDLARSSNFGFNNSWWTPTPGQEGTQPGMAFPTQSQVGGLFLQMQDAANAANNAAPAISPMEQWYNNGYDSRNAADLFGGS